MSGDNELERQLTLWWQLWPRLFGCSVLILLTLLVVWGIVAVFWQIVQIGEN